MLGLSLRVTLPINLRALFCMTWSRLNCVVESVFMGTVGYIREGRRVALNSFILLFSDSRRNL